MNWVALCAAMLWYWLPWAAQKVPPLSLLGILARFDKIKAEGVYFELCIVCFFEANITLSDCWVCGGTLMPIPLKAKMLLKSFLCCRCY